MMWSLRALSCRSSASSASSSLSSSSSLCVGGGTGVLAISDPGAYILHGAQVIDENLNL